jgi:oxygen-independent coproporphyrinogen-3 oxidase
LARRALVGWPQRFAFLPVPDRVRDLAPVARAGAIDIYLHIPFCRNSCPYCPYNTVPYEEGLVEPFTRAVLAEIDLDAARLGRLPVPSVYVGGGTPTCVMDSLERIIARLRERFDVAGRIGVESNPAQTDPAMARRLKAAGATMVSLGIQSFDDRFLRLLGRSYDSSAIAPAVRALKDQGFETVNADLMFALPGQEVEDVIGDLKRAFAAGADQVTLYPLFTFPYTRAGKFLRLRGLVMPPLAARRRMYRAIHEWCLDNGYRRLSVWAFGRGDGPRYSSVTRDHYIGIGPGAGTFTGEAFTLNTFDIAEYAAALARGQFPVSLSLAVGKRLARYYWLYWRLYDTRFSAEAARQVMGEDWRRAAFFLRLAGWLGLARRAAGSVELTERGAFWIHLAQNYFALSYIDRVWTASMRQAWPGRVDI